MAGILGNGSACMLFATTCTDSGGVLRIWCAYQINRQIRQVISSYLV